jgi:MFS family permease
MPIDKGINKDLLIGKHFYLNKLAKKSNYDIINKIIKLYSIMNTNEIINHKEKLDNKKIKAVNFISLMFGFSQALLIYVISSYFKKFFSTESIGFFYFFAYLVFLLALLNFHKIIRKIGEANTFFISFFILTSSLLVLKFAANQIIGIVFIIIYMIFSNLSIVGLDIILESCSIDKMSGRVRGAYLSLSNAGFIFGPLISTNLLDKYGFNSIFLAAFLINAFVFLFALIKFRGLNYKFAGRTGIAEIIGKIWQRKNIMRVYYINFILEVFFAVMVIYSPIYLKDLGFSWPQIGFIFTIMLVPFVILPYPLGWLADTKLGEKELLFFAIIILSSSTLSIYFINTTSIFIWALVMLLTRIGSASIQILRDSYFYKRIDRADIDLIDFFRTAVPAGYIATMVFSLIFLAFFPLKYIFIFLSLLIISGLYPLVKMVDSR